jgi:hypothetical protein
VRNLRFSPKQEAYRVGEEVRCEASGNPEPKIILLPDVAQNSGEGYKSIIIDPKWEGTEMKMRCEASNTFQGEVIIQSKNITFKVLGQYPPRPQGSHYV